MKKMISSVSPITADLIAPCGIDCGVCLAYLRKNNPCHGCRKAQENKPKTRVNCKIRNCTKRKSRYCCDCPEFPCERLVSLDKRYREKYDMSEIANLKFIKDEGINKFIAAQRKKYQSSKGTYCVHNKKYY